MIQKLRVAFMGTPDFAVPSLQALVDHPAVEMVAVYTRAPKPKGRGHKVQISPIHALAEQHSIPVYTPKGFRKSEENRAQFHALNLDIAFVAAYGLILPQEILDMPRFGCINVHGSILPRWRGAAPIHRAIEAGDAETGITMMQMDAGLDTGDMLIIGETPIAADDTTITVHDRLASMGGRLVTQTVDQILAETLAPTPQPEKGVSYAHKIDKAESVIDWTHPAEVIARKARAFTPWPALQTAARLETEKLQLKILAVEMIEDSHHAPETPAGLVLDDKLTVACGLDGNGVPTAIRITRLQRAGKAPADAEAFLRGTAISMGTLLR